MSPLEIVRTAIANTFRSRLRTSLTVLAIFVGAFTLTLTNGVGTGINAYITTQVDSMGASDVMIVTKARAGGNPFAASDEGPTVHDAGRATAMSGEGMQIEVLTDRDLAAILAIDGITRVEPFVTVTTDYVTREAREKYDFTVATGGVGLNVDFVAGRPLREDDAHALILPVSYLTPLGFDDADAALGGLVTIGITDVGGQLHLVEAEIVGVQEVTIFDSGTLISARLKEALHEAQMTGMPAGYRDVYMMASARFEPGRNALGEKGIKEALAGSGYAGSTLQDQLGMMTSVITGIVWVLNAFGIIALVAAGFGIINTLLMSVQERTREIGLMKSMGMSRARLFALFSSEAIFIGFLGSALGAGVAIVAGTIVSTLLAEGPLASLAGLRVIAFDPLPVALVVALVMTIAFFAGTLPAARASRLDAIDALRYE
ncbi:MAG: ABC transporter permease [Gemmatimonadaceae bacterium]|nr:ABC transporter permease [Gemmatimonadaceae bacterium]